MAELGDTVSAGLVRSWVNTDIEECRFDCELAFPSRDDEADLVCSLNGGRFVFIVGVSEVVRFDRIEVLRIVCRGNSSSSSGSAGLSLE
jgi:hypothetical protein